MDGSKSYTICGDALYFAPEIVSQMGYDYSADLWAFGILMFEFYEGHNPFGNDETEETLLFKAISGYHFNRIKFSSANQVVKTMIRRILDPKGKNRLGYKSSEDVRRTDYFAGKKIKHSVHCVFHLITTLLDLVYSNIILEMFVGIPWLALGSADGYPLDIQQSIDPQPLFSAASSDIKNYKSELFDHF